MTLRIEDYQAADLDPMMALWRAATAVAHDFMDKAGLDRDEAMIRDELIGKTETWTAWRDDELVGFISLMGGMIVALFVDPARHRGGIGCALIAHANRLHGSLEVEVFAENTNGISFYRKNGFERRREEENTFYPGHLQWIMGQEGAAPGSSRDA